MNKNTLQDKENFEAITNLTRLRGSSYDDYEATKKSINDTYASVWDKKPIDFSPRLYHPRPPKRNSRESMKPWKYGRDSHREVCGSVSSSAKLRIPLDLKDYLRDKSHKEMIEETRSDFQRSFRLLTANGARIEASKSMGFRDGLDQYRNPEPHDFRGVIEK